MTQSAPSVSDRHRESSSSRLPYSLVRLYGGSGRSRFDAYHSTSLSRNSTSCSRSAIARTSARYVHPCPLPQEDVIESPRIKMRSRRGALMIGSWPQRAAPFPAPRHGGRRYAREATVLWLPYLSLA